MEEVKKEEVVVPPVVNTEVDERGVPWKNVAMENERKLNEISERLARMEVNAVSQPIPQIPSPATPNSVDPQREIEEFTTNPDVWYQKKRAQERAVEQQSIMQQKLAEARALIASRGADKYNENYTKVMAMTEKWGLNTSDPVKTVQKAFELLDLENNASMSQREKQLAQETSKKNEEEAKRNNEIKKTQAVGGSKPPVATKVVNQDYIDNVREKGDIKSVNDFFRNNVFNDDRK